jgi:subtilisin family serine protease
MRGSFSRSRSRTYAFRRRLLLVGLAVLAALVVSSPSATSAPAAEATHIVQLAEPPLALYNGGIAGLAPTMPAARGETRLNPASAASVAYLGHLTSRQNAVKAAIDVAVGRSVAVKFRYRTAYNGLALQLTDSEAQRVAGVPGVRRVQADETRQLLTDAGPAWIGAGGIYDGSQTGGLPGTKGEGVVVGIIDTGINHDHPSFADVGGDGFNHTNPRTQHYGACAPLNPVLCNDKLIGMYDFTGTTPFDDNAHGSHTASTVAGNVLSASLVAPTLTYTKPISGVAPHANIIAYKACTSLPAVTGCQVSATVASIDQATLDMVSVINFSIGGASRNPWTDPNAIAFLGANAAGVFGSVSAGNDGPGSSTIGSPSDSPWVMSVGASTHNRSLLSQLTDMAGGAVAPPATITGKSVASGVGPASIVYAGAPPYNTPLCGAGTADPTTGVGSEPAFDPGELAGKIVVCDRGTYGRVAKGQEVKNAGGIGMVLVNDAANGDSLTADMHVLPAVHISFDDGVALKAWLAGGGTNHTARITGLVENTAPANGDVMASFSSRGPNPSVPGIIKPDVTAPGVDVYAAFNTPLTSVPPTAPEYGIISGTSMSSPHAAGAAALLRKLKPGWTPSQLKSALMTTGFTTPPGLGAEAHGVLKEDSATPATPFEMGGGRVELRRAARAGLLLDVSSPLDYLAADPTQGGDPKTLNIASMANETCQTSCTWTRRVTNAASVPVAWTASVTNPANATLTVSPATFTLAPGAAQVLTITATNNGGTPNAWRFGAVTLTPPGASGLVASRLPVAIRATGVSVDPCVVPDETVVTDPSNDQVMPTGVPSSPAYDIQSLAVAGINPTLDGNPGSFIQWTLKVGGLDPDNLPRNSSWRMVWTSGPTTYFVDMNTFEPTGVKFEYGALDANGIFQTQGAADKGTFTPDGTIKVAVAASKVGSPAVGAVLTAINADTVLLVGGAGTGLLANVDTTSEGTYTLRQCGATPTGPNAVNDTATTPQGAAITINVLANDTHPQNQALDVTTATDPPHGAAVVNANETITYTPDAGYSGTDSFTYTVRDPGGATDTATVLVTIEPRCPTGTFFDDVESGTNGWTVQTEANELPASTPWAVTTDLGAKSASRSWFSDATTLMLKDDRLVMPAQDLTAGSLLSFWHRFRFEPDFDGGVLEVSTDGGTTWKDILEAGGSFVEGGYTGTIDATTGSPIAGRPAWTAGFADAVTAPMTQVTVNVGALAGPDRLFRFRLTTDPLSIGALPGHGWWIDDVKVTNTALDCPPPPNQVPVARDDTASTNKNTAVTIGVLANDTDPDGDTLTVAVTEEPSNGTATRNADNTVTYTPNAGFVGTDSFRYSASDGKGGVSIARVTVTVVDESGPTPCFKHSPKKPNKNTQIKFDGACSSDEQSPDSALVFEWDFTSNGTYDATGIKVKHRFGAAGTYTVTLRVTDPAGNANTTSKQITVKHDDDDDDDDGPEFGGGGDDDDGGDD